MKFVKKFSEILPEDCNLVGGKTASLGLMYNALASHGIRVPGGFGITSDAYWHFVNSNHLMPIIEKIMDGLTDYNDVTKIKEVGQQIRNLFHIAPMPVDLAEQIHGAYVQLGMQYSQKKSACGGAFISNGRRFARCIICRTTRYLFKHFWKRCIV